MKRNSILLQIPLPQEASEVRKTERKARKAAKLQGHQTDEQKSQLLPTNKERYEVENFVIPVNIDLKTDRRISNG